MTPLLSALFMLVSTSPPLADVYARARTYERATFQYRTPSPERQERVRSLFARLAVAPSGPPAKELEESAAAAGFELMEAHDAAGKVRVVREPEGHREGGGLYVLRPGGSAVCVQAPHTFFDEGTGDIALDLFASLGAACLFTNTVHRYSPSDEGEKKADLAHAEQSLFLAATEGLLSAVAWPIVQVHGFGDREGIPAEVAAVVSDGTAKPPPEGPATRLREALAARLAPSKVFLYPHDIHELGATTNREGAFARAHGIGFLHVELSATARKLLRRLGAKPLSSSCRLALELP